jgi:pSer/pThr/pTyr-binding forkhead associated (FHA) protein
MGLYFKVIEKEHDQNINKAATRNEFIFQMTDLEKFFLGRGEKCHLQINDEFLSDKHCFLRFDGDHLILKDLESKNGTYVNGNKIFESFICLDDVINIGYCLISIDPKNTSVKYKVMLSNKKISRGSDIELPSPKNDLTKIIKR